MKKVLLLALIFLLLKNVSIAQEFKNDNQIIYHFYTGTKKVITCYSIQNSFTDAYDSGQFDNQFVNSRLKIYISCVDSIIQVLKKNPLFINKQNEVITFQDGWNKKTKPSVFNIMNTRKGYTKSALKSITKSIIQLNDYLSSIFYSVNDENLAKFDKYNLNGLTALLNAQPNSTIDTFTFRAYKIISEHPIVLNVFDEICDECLEVEYNGNTESIRELLPHTKSVIKENSTVFYTEGKNTLILEKIHKNSNKTTLVLKVMPPN
ncbi:MAG: hypothetical protein IE931_01010 [Sphingobacteriales bacterium]|nr:hypothetical protein [Sphingobacteriales bacterium]